MARIHRDEVYDVREGQAPAPVGLMRLVLPIPVLVVATPERRATAPCMRLVVAVQQAQERVEVDRGREGSKRPQQAQQRPAQCT